MRGAALSRPATNVDAPGHPSLTAYAESVGRRVAEATSDEDKRLRGQIFTPARIATLIAEALGPLGTRVRLLDPGAGVGILTAAVCERAARAARPTRVEVDVFENDATVIPALRGVLETCAASLAARGHRLEARLYDEDFLDRVGGVGATPLFRRPIGPYDAVVMNPPYFKVGRDSEHAHLDLGEAGHNAYALFMACAVDLLDDAGRLTAITPRSFCNGPYFRRFRKRMFEKRHLESVRVFESRRTTFAAQVLQESVISTWCGRSPRRRVTRIVADDGDRGVALSLPTVRVVDRRGGDVVRLPTSRLDCDVLEFVERLPTTFEDAGLTVATGRVVAFRARGFLRNDPSAPATVPLLTMHHVRPPTVVWPIPGLAGKPQALALGKETEALLIPAEPCVLLRRFSAKEDRKRLIASVLDPSSMKTLSKGVAVENHVNVIARRDAALSSEEAFGVAAILNSSLFDRYFRILSGNTQVNAAEVRSLPFPDSRTVARIGRRMRASDRLDPPSGDVVVCEELSIPETSARKLLGR
ncbi:MAG TPA: Eco57I restriction-modification methylase domain-containing protein [Planctomycetota bacterium]|nr:Eco57I restriction-modification methylase domain-containing protein [Planctomycetota bacterium]